MNLDDDAPFILFFNLNINWIFLASGTRILRVIHGRDARATIRSRRATYSAVIKPRMSRNFRSLMPRTISRCSARRKGPYCVRCAMMRSAITLPTPGSFSSSRAPAALMFIREALSALGSSKPAWVTPEACRGSVPQAELCRVNAIIKATVRTPMLRESDLAGGKFCFTYASK